MKATLSRLGATARSSSVCDSVELMRTRGRGCAIYLCMHITSLKVTCCEDYQERIGDHAG
jgi:hypothetical protein